MHAFIVSTGSQLFRQVRIRKHLLLRSFSSRNGGILLNGCTIRRVCVAPVKPVLSVVLCRACSSARRIDSGELKRLLRQAKPERFRLGAAVLLLFVSSSVMIAFPFCIGKVIDVIYTASNNDELRANLNWICKVLTGAVVIGGLANFGRVYLMNSSAQRIINSLRKQAHASLMQQEIAFFDQNRTGDLITRLSSDTALVGMSLTQNISDGLRSAVAVFGGVSMMLYTSPQLSLVGLSVVPPVAIISFAFAGRLRQVAADVQTQLAQSSAIAEEQLSHIRTVRAFTKESFEIKRYAEGLSRLLDKVNTETWLRAVFFGCTGATGNMIVLAVLYYGGILMSDGRLTVGNLSSFLLYAAYVGVSIGGLGGFFTEATKALGASKKVWEIADRVPALPNSGGLALSNLQGHIEFCNVTFAYPSRPDIDVLKKLNLAVPAGSVVAIVGPSGQGKSTLASLLLRLYDPSSGIVMLDGIDIRDLEPHFLRVNVGIVSQEPTLFATSIFENILYGAKSMEKSSKDDVIRAASEANALEFIQGLPDGFNTMVGERGILLSGGQKQRIAIARAILRDPSVLILDEATSSLDAVSERAVQEALKKLMVGRTVLTIAHRLSTIRRADKIAVLKAGTVVEFGTYEQLMSITDGLFRRLVEHQLQDERTAE
ncbi:ATP-binding cassette sub-family B member 10, mitochondrial-like [Dermacentor variabilis]|uniref:ATP-binding cassette sub-family B member 10, mitochondrial-like n=1 Tax=Dermacentor variabilis TaxID=34621 RepID=UPI003F5B2FA4